MCRVGTAVKFRCAPIVAWSSCTSWALAQVLQSFLLAPSDHPKLLSLLHKWPTTVYSVSTLTEDVLTRCV